MIIVLDEMGRPAIVIGVMRGVISREFTYLVLRSGRARFRTPDEVQYPYCMQA